MLHKEKMFFDIPRPKKPLLPPKVLNDEELKKMFSAVTNIKHKAILFTAYSAGLRVSETVHLRVQDIDSVRMQIFVKRAKGKKDRVVGLSVIVLDVLRHIYAGNNQGQSIIYLLVRMAKNPIVSEVHKKYFSVPKSRQVLKRK